MDGEGITEPAVRFREMTEGEAVVEDYVAMRLTLRSHPMALLRAGAGRCLTGSPDGAAVVGGIEAPLNGVATEDRPGVGAGGSCGRSAGSISGKEQIAGHGNATPAVGTTTVRRESFPRRRGDLPFCGHRDSSLYRPAITPRMG